MKPGPITKTDTKATSAPSAKLAGGSTPLPGAVDSKPGMGKAIKGAQK